MVNAIVIFESSGIHANGLTLARKIAGKLPKGYLTPFLTAGPMESLCWIRQLSMSKLLKIA